MPLNLKKPEAVHRRVAQALLLLILSIWIGGLPTEGTAAVWSDDFSDPALKGWRLLGQSSEWQVEEGVLHVSMWAEIGIDMLQLTALPSPYSHLTIAIADVRIHKSNFGIALGRRAGRPTPEAFYLFMMSGVHAHRLSGRGDIAPLNFSGWPRQNPDDVWLANQLDELRVTFRDGEFEVFANGQFRTRFSDPHFDVIDVIGLVVYGVDSLDAEAWVDSFMLLGSWSVESHEKLSTIWAQFKRS